MSEASMAAEIAALRASFSSTWPRSISRCSALPAVHERQYRETLSTRFRCRCRGGGPQPGWMN